MKSSCKIPTMSPHSTQPLSPLLTDKFLSKYKTVQPKWGFDGLGFVIYKRTYARPILNEAGEVVRTEQWWETVRRCIEGAQAIGADYTREEAEELFDHVFNLRCSFSGRGLWQLGTKTIDQIGADSLLNCWLSKVSEVDDFCFIFMESMLGGGVSEVITREYSHELPRVKKEVRCRLKNTKDADYIVPDSKEGWCELWRRIIYAYLVDGKSFTYSAICIRPAGEPLKTFGGIAPGPKPLVEGVQELCKIFERREGKKLRTQDVADIICCGGEVVKSGGIRRTALLLHGDVDDVAFLQLKRWDLGGEYPPYRANSNNSIICSNYEHILDRYWEGFNGNGEAYGLINLKNCKRFGRIGEEKFEGFDLYDDSILGVNPCAEATLADKEPCNLSELFLNNITSKEQMLRCAILLYKTQKAIAGYRYLHEASNRIAKKNMRIGIGVTGVCQVPKERVKEWCDYTYRHIRAFDKKYSKEKGVAVSIRLSVVKPSGTLSLVAGATPGANEGFAPFHIRRVRFDSHDKLLPILRRAGYHIEPEERIDGTLNHDLLVVSFPCKFEGDISHGGSITDQLERVKMLQTCWADQAVSNTIYYTKDDVPAIKEWLKANYNSSVKSVSFLLRTGHGFKQAPLEAITEEKYKEMVAKIQPIKRDELGDVSGNLLESTECAGGACPVR